MHTQKNIQEQAIYATQSMDRNASQISSLSAAMIEKVSCRKAIIVLNNLGIKNIAIADYLNCSIFTIYRWIQFNAKIDSLDDRLRSGRKAIYTPETHLRIIAFYCQTKPLSGCGRWTLRWAARYLKVHSEQINVTPRKSTIQRVLKKNMLKPHLSQYFFFLT